MAIEAIPIQAYIDAETNDNAVNSFDKDKDQSFQTEYFIYTTEDSRDHFRFTNSVILKPYHITPKEGFHKSSKIMEIKPISLEKVIIHSNSIQHRCLWLRHWVT